MWADDIVATADLPADAHRRVRRVWSDIRTEVLGGQYLDIVAESSGAESVASAMTVNIYKTASYTISRPLQFGAAAAADRPDVLADLPRARQRTSGWRSSCATTCSACSATRRSPASRRATTCAPASARCCWPRRSSGPRSRTRVAAKLLRTSIGTELSDAQVKELCLVIESVGALAAVEEHIDSLTRRSLEILNAAPIDVQAKAASPSSPDWPRTGPPRSMTTPTPTQAPKPGRRIIFGG